MKRICLHIIIAIVLSNYSTVISAQSLQPAVIGTLGGYSAPIGAASLSYNMGETFVATLAIGSSVLTQGFEQPFIISSINGDTVICAGFTTSYADSTMGGSWSSSNITIATVGSTGIVTGIVPGVDTISYNVFGMSTFKTITINPLPAAGTITGASSVCVAATTTLTDVTAGGIWSSSNTTATVSTGVVTGVTAGTDTIRYTVTNTCGTAIASKTITINPLPSAGTITGSSSVCIGATTTLTDGTTGGVWSSGSRATVLGGVVTGVSSGVDTIKYAVTNVCGTATAIKTITVNPLPVAGSILGASSVCVGAATTLTDGTTGGIWSSGSRATVLSGVATGVSSGLDTIRYAVTNLCGTATAIKTITINPLPIAGSISGASSVCVGATITLTDGITGGIWSSSNSLASVSGGSILGAAAGLDTIRYAVTNICGTAIATKTITINPLPFAGSISGASSVCVSAATTLTDGITGGIWSSGSLATIGSAGSLSGVVTGVTSGMDTINYAVTNVCGTAVTTKTIIINPLAHAGIITGAASVCVGDSAVLADSITGGTWSTGNSTAAIGSAGSLSGVVTGLLAGIDTIRYAVANTCNTAVATKIITVNPLPVAGAISGASGDCIGFDIFLTDTEAGGVWSSSNPGIGTVSGGVITGISVGTTIISYIVTNVCGTAASAKNIAVSGLPSAGSIMGDSSVCPDSTIILTETVSGGIWSSVNGLVNVGSAGSLSAAVTGITEGADAIVYAVTNICGTGEAIFPIEILPGGTCTPSFINTTFLLPTTLKIYPNPNNGSFAILLSAPIDESATVTITDIIGRKVEVITIASNIVSDVELNEAAGVYIISVDSGEGIFVDRVTVSGK
jgi:hypothetical protein